MSKAEGGRLILLVNTFVGGLMDDRVAGYCRADE